MKIVVTGTRGIPGILDGFFDYDVNRLHTKTVGYSGVFIAAPGYISVRPEILL